MESLLAVLAPLINLVVAWGPYVLVAYGVFATIVVIMVVAIFVAILKDF